MENSCFCFEDASRTLKSFNNALIGAKTINFIKNKHKRYKSHENNKKKRMKMNNYVCSCKRSKNREHLFKSLENAPKTLEQGPPGQTHSPRRQTLSEPLGAPPKPAEPPELYRPSSAHTPSSGNAAKKNPDGTAAQLPATSPFRLGRCSRLIPCRWSRCC